MAIKELKKSLLQVRVSTKLKDRYIEFCEKNGYLISKRIRIFIENELRDEKKDK